jgi:hypothetical protein
VGGRHALRLDETALLADVICVVIIALNNAAALAAARWSSLRHARITTQIVKKSLHVSIAEV